MATTLLNNKVFSRAQSLKKGMLATSMLINDKPTSLKTSFLKPDKVTNLSKVPNAALKCTGSTMQRCML